MRPIPPYLMQEHVDWYADDKWSVDITRTMDCFLFQGERDFELKIWPYPYEVALPRIEDLDELDLRIQTCNTWLTRFHPSLYLAFPSQSVGQYKYCGLNSVFFKQQEHALAFKLRFA